MRILAPGLRGKADFLQERVNSPGEFPARNFARGPASPRPARRKQSCADSRKRRGPGKPFERRNALRASEAPRNAVNSRPSRMTAPAVGRINCRMVRPRVDLPQPDSPTSPRISPWRNENDTPSTALTAPSLRLNTNPFSTGKYVLRFRTSRKDRARAHFTFWVATPNLNLNPNLNLFLFNRIKIKIRIKIRSQTAELILTGSPFARANRPCHAGGPHPDNTISSLAQ